MDRTQSIRDVIAIKQDGLTALQGALNDPTLTKALEPISAVRPLAISLDIQKADPVLNFKTGNLRQHLAERGITE